MEFSNRENTKVVVDVVFRAINSLPSEVDREIDEGTISYEEFLDRVVDKIESMLIKDLKDDVSTSE